MKEEEIKRLGYEAVAGNLYKKDDTLYVQQDGEIKKASELTEEQLQHVTSFTAYKAELKKLSVTIKQKTPKTKKDEKKAPGKKEEPSEAVVLRGNENDLMEILRQRSMDLIIEASPDSKHPGKGILYYDEKVGNINIIEPSVELVDMMTSSMGGIETEIVEWGMKTLKHPVKGDTEVFFAIVKATDNHTGTSGLGTAVEIINWAEIGRDNNPKDFSLTKAIRKAERNAKERLIPIPRKVMVTLVKKMIQEHIKKS